MKSNPAPLALLPLVLLSSAAGPCSDQNLGSVDDSGPDAGPDVGAGNDARSLPADARGGVDAVVATDGPAIYVWSKYICSADDQCVGTNYYRPVASQADCYCN